MLKAAQLMWFSPGASADRLWGMESAMDYHTARALLEWQIELGATEAILDAPVNRYETPAQKPKPKADAPIAPIKKPKIDPVQVAKTQAQGAGDLAALKATLAQFEHCDLRRGARSMVFADGNPAAKVMIIGEAPGRDEDREGRPFVGRVGQLFDRMFAAIDLSRDGSEAESSVYVTNILPWRPPQNRDPKADEIAMMMPFVARHVELANPDILVLMGNIACQGVLGKRGVSRLRGHWVEAFGKPALPMYHPDALMRNPVLKREAWADLLDLKSRLNGKG